MTEAVSPRDAIVSALRDLGSATSAELRARTELGKTTVNDRLRELVNDGTVEKQGIPPRSRYKLAEPVGADALPEAGEGWEYTHAGGDVEPLSNEDEPKSADPADVLSFMESVAPAPTEEELSQDETKTPKRKKAETRHDFCTAPVQREALDEATGQTSPVTVPCGAPIHTEGRSWVHDSEDAPDHKPTTKAFREPRAEREPKEGGMSNPHEGGFARGELKGAVVAWMQSPSNRDSDHTVAAIAKGVGAYPGSTAFILKKLDAEGVVKLTQESGKAEDGTRLPAKYQAA